MCTDINRGLTCSYYPTNYPPKRTSNLMNANTVQISVFSHLPPVSVPIPGPDHMLENASLFDSLPTRKLFI